MSSLFRLSSDEVQGSLMASLRRCAALGLGLFPPGLAQKTGEPGRPAVKSDYQCEGLAESLSDRESSTVT